LATIAHCCCTCRFIRDDDPETRLAATVHLTLPYPLPPGCRSALDLKLKAELRFGGTELMVTAWETTSNKPVSTSIKFATS
jgi:hypothetical protein